MLRAEDATPIVTDWIAIAVAGFALIISLVAVLYSRSQARAADRQAKAAIEQLRVDTSARFIINSPNALGGADWILTNVGKGTADRVEVFLDFDVANKYGGPFDFSHIGPGMSATISPKQPFPSITDLTVLGPNRLVKPAMVTIEWLSYNGTRRTATVKPSAIAMGA